LACVGFHVGNGMEEAIPEKVASNHVSSPHSQQLSI